MKALFIALALMPTLAQADMYFKYGLSIGQDSLPSSKLFSVGKQTQLPRGVFLQYDAGIVNTPGYAQKLAGLFGISLGLEVKPSENIRVQASWGPSLYTRKDAQLGGPFQFNQDLCIDAVDRNNFVGLCYKHVSSGGIYSPNKGIDAAQIRIGVRF